MRSGVPQGAALGHILFIFYINDLSSVVNSQCLIFTDDTILYPPIHSDTNVFQLQRDPDALCEWSSKWQLLFNFSKYTLLSIGHRTHPNNYSMESFILKMLNLQRVWALLLISF